jgi:Lsr2
MAQITHVKLVDDLDGGEAAESVAFSLDGKSYEIDLSDKHAAALRDAVAPFTSSARRAGNGSKVASRQRMAMRVGRPREDTAAIRQWANANGLEVSARGRISSTVLEAYENRGNAPAASAVATSTPAAPVAESAVEGVVEAEAKPKHRTRKKATAEG